MELSDQFVDLSKFFPFSCCEQSVAEKAKKLGKVVKYETGETVLFSGSPAKHCGLIISGQAVAFKKDSSGHRYQLCLDEGCLVGLETITPGNSYTAKIAALSDLVICFWNSDGLEQLMEDPDFSAGVRICDEGRVYQEQWLIPETDITDPVVCSRGPHWLSAFSPVFLIIPLLLVCLAVSGVLIRRYAAAWLLVFPLLAAAGSLLYKQITARLNEHLIVTSKNLILIPQDQETEMKVMRLAGLQSITIKRNIFERLFGLGKILFETENSSCSTPLLGSVELISGLIHEFAVRASLGRVIPLRDGSSTLHQKTVKISDADPVPENALKYDKLPEIPPFKTVKMHAHWIMLVRNSFKLLAVIGVSLYAMYYFRSSTHADVIRKCLMLAAGAALCGIIYQFFVWKNHLFIIEEDCIKNYDRKPFSNENLQVAMNHKIQSVSYEKGGFFPVLFNYGTIYILAGEGELAFEYVSDPQRVQQLIMDTCARYEAKLRLEEEARRKVYISDLFHEIRNEANGLSL